MNNEPGEVAAVRYQKVSRQTSAGTFPSLEFVDIPANLRGEPFGKWTFVVYGIAHSREGRILSHATR